MPPPAETAPLLGGGGGGGGGGTRGTPPADGAAWPTPGQLASLMPHDVSSFDGWEQYVRGPSQPDKCFGFVGGEGDGAAAPGGVHEDVVRLARVLRTDHARGLGEASAAALEARRKRFGENVVALPEPPGVLELMWEALQDETLIALLAAAMVELLICFDSDKTSGEPPWLDAVAIIVTVAVVVTVTALLDHSREVKFRDTNAQGLEAKCMVMRGMGPCQVDTKQVVVGDVLQVRGRSALRPQRPRPRPRPLDAEV